MRADRVVILLGAALLGGCVSGNKIRADAEVISADVDRARRSGAMRCAPRELATAVANLDFAQAELAQGSSFRAGEHIREADAAAKKALFLSKDCAPKQVVVKEKPVERPVVVRIEETDRDGDGIPDHLDRCPDEPEDFDGFEDEDGCPDLDNDKDGIPDTEDRCPNAPGPLGNNGCPANDRDGDGIPDHLDSCPDQPEDMDGFQDEDGCPDLDNDGDGLMDTVDRCPNEPGPIENRGCPIRDRDGDGIPDHLDRCPDEPEDMDGFQDEDGCPDLDNDKDGIPDAKDLCPDEAGPQETGGCPDRDRDRDGVVDRFDRCPDEPGSPDNQGCPDPDRDRDGIPDRLDRCPDEPGVAEEQGCPKQYKMVVVRQDRIEIKQQINFATGSHTILGKPSFEILDDVARALNDNPRIKKVRIEGHTDSVGSDDTNLRLSQRRADAVMAELIRRNVDPARMEAVGYGEAKPIASNATASGRAENRRTEFNIVEQ
jgi:OmpA-OmpF porin, OOP family